MSKARFSYRELICAFIAGAVLVAYGFFALLLAGKCVCSEPVDIGGTEITTLIQWGMVVAAWLVILVMAIGVHQALRDR